ncbi:hypothetical protein O9G_005228 [Rozella allomycis CSF55]|uniref:Uncharacterized protein n=1 Tax=Rozella allomycis (strain CSF55) TaxID=988480 RepID=A0A075B3C3_ROZAC|nr:hypothetical protein O9G_005228 [Rozella allomycis CSF55]|eukprot:EPZ35466.1 hypothetical protein O9G_005228 [Rozella allomycis CSF55]
MRKYFVKDVEGQIAHMKQMPLTDYDKWNLYTAAAKTVLGATCGLFLGFNIIHPKSKISMLLIILVVRYYRFGNRWRHGPIALGISGVFIGGMVGTHCAVTKLIFMNTPFCQELKKLVYE